MGCISTAEMKRDESEFRMMVANMLRQLTQDVLEGRADARVVMLALMLPSVEAGFDSEEEFPCIVRAQPPPEAGVSRSEGNEAGSSHN